MIEKRIEIPGSQVTGAGISALETLDAVKDDSMVDVYFPRNDDTDFIVQNPDGSITRVAHCVSINGVRFHVPSETHTKIPKLVYEHLMQSFASLAEAERLNNQIAQEACIGIL